MNIKAYLFGDSKRATYAPSFWAPTGPSGHIMGADTAFEISNAPWNYELWNAIAPGCRSLSVGDFVVVDIDGVQKGFICKGCGWTEVAPADFDQVIAKLQSVDGFWQREQAAKEFDHDVAV